MSDYWKDNNIVKPQQIVVCAACRYNTLILCGARHWDKVMNKQLDTIRRDAPDIHGYKFDQGFIDQFGQFLTRVEAMQVVKDNGQPFNKKRNGGSDIELYSEGLY